MQKQTTTKQTSELNDGLTLDMIVWSSRPEIFCKKGAIKNFTKFTVKHLRQSLFFNKSTARGLQLY